MKRDETRRDETKRNKTIYEIAKFFLDNSKPVHITLHSGQWFNGKIISISDDRLVLVEEKFGEMLVLFERIIDDGIKPREEEK